MIYKLYYKLRMMFQNVSIAFKIAFSFAAVIFIGSILLSLPISQLASSEASYFDHLFTSTSMVCVTGLFTQPVYTTYSRFGQWVNILLMQIGGLGIMTLVSVVFMQLGRRMSFRNEVTLGEALNRDQLSNFQRFIRIVVKYTLFIELLGMLALSFHFVPELGWNNGLFTSLYLSVSAFNNAGFDNFGIVSLQPYVKNVPINLIISSLIIVGGIGFSVWIDVSKMFKDVFLSKRWSLSSIKRRYARLEIHTQLVLNFSFFLIVSGTLLFLVSEWNNPTSIKSFSFGHKVLASYFQSVTMRTAGFATLDYTSVKLFSIMVFCGLMFVGGSPGGTAGGPKTSTIALIGKLLVAETKGEKNVNYKHHTIPLELIRHGLVIIIAFISILFTGIALIALFDSDKPFQYLVFEVFSALNTVGVSANLTSTLTQKSQTIIMILMFIGRLGPITIFTALGQRRQKSKKEVVYATGRILIG